MSDIHTHDQLEAAVRHLAERRGWRSTIRNVGIDPLDPLPWGPRETPGRGDVVLERKTTGAVVTFEYELPESFESLEKTIGSVVDSDVEDTDRRRDPAKYRRAIEI